MNCNFQCRHCYNFDRVNDKQSPYSNPLGLPEIHHIIDQLSEMGTLKISLTGGEPLLHPHFFSIVEKIRSHQMICKIKTNASLVDQAMAIKLQKYGVTQADISLYGVNDTTYQSFTGHRKGFQKSWQGALALHRAGIETEVALIIHSGNYHEVEEVYNLCQENGIPFTYTFDITERHDGNINSKLCKISSEQFIELLQGPVGYLFHQDAPMESLSCACGKTNCAIGVEGDLYSCIGVADSCGSLRKNSFRELWYNSKKLNKIRNSKFEDFKDCSKCPINNFCDRGNDTAYSNTGNYFGKDPFSCKTAQIRSQYQ